MSDWPIRAAGMLLLLLLLFLLLLAGSCGRPEPAVRSPGTGMERGSRSQGPAAPRDPRHKDKFLQHLTGPLHFNPKCRRHFYRLYHGTRDCTVPDYYKRCARLLTRLANSPRCAER